jgi:gluconolactonase
MRRHILVTLSLLATVTCLGGAPAEEAEAVAIVAFTEGPTVDAAGNVYFTETRGERILKFTPGKGVTTFRENSNGANGLIFDEQWRLIACEGGAKPRITRTDVKTGKIEVLAEGDPIKRPNDVTIDGKGRIYFTDYAGKAIYRIDRNGKMSRILALRRLKCRTGS